MSEAGDRPVVDGTEPAGPIAPGGTGGGPEQAADEPVSGTPDPGASHADSDAARMGGGEQPAAPNQQKTEPVPPSPPQDPPDPAGGRPDSDAGTSAGPGPRAGDALGDRPDGASEGASAQGVPVPSEIPAEGTSEGSAPVDGVALPAVAPEGLADGETDVTMPSTTHF